LRGNKKLTEFTTEKMKAFSIAKKKTKKSTKIKAKGQLIGKTITHQRERVST